MRSPSAPNWADTLVCPYGLVGMKGNGEIASPASGPPEADNDTQNNFYRAGLKPALRL